MEESSESHKELSPTDALIEQLNAITESSPEADMMVRSYLRSQLEHWRNNPERGSAIAYEIAGVMSASGLEAVTDASPNKDALREIFKMAGDLELPAAHQGSGSSWDNLAQLIESLGTGS
jgi:hypothetical protein